MNFNEHRFKARHAIGSALPMLSYDDAINLADSIYDEVIKDVVHLLRNIDTLDRVPGAKISMPTYNILWDAATLVEQVFGVGECGISRS